MQSSTHVLQIAISDVPARMIDLGSVGRSPQKEHRSDSSDGGPGSGGRAELLTELTLANGVRGHERAARSSDASARAAVDTGDLTGGL